jgi:hypothetical protein
MNQKNIILLLLWLLLDFDHSYAQLQTITGQLINGKGTFEKLDHVRVACYLNSELVGNSFTNEQGKFEFNLTTGISTKNSIIHQFILFQNYPNPFKPNTTISYSLNRSGNVRLDIFNVLGQKIRTLLNNVQTLGVHSILWDGKNQNGDFCRPGTYFYRFKFEDQVKIRKMSLLNMPANYSSGNLLTNPTLPKTLDDERLEIKITDRDIEDTTIFRTFDILPAKLDLNQINIHVYPFVKSAPDTLMLMSGENVSDTLDIYFENPVEIFSNEINIAYDFIADSLLSITYFQVTNNRVSIRINEINDSKSSYSAAYFKISPRIKLSKRKFNRGYIGIPYQDYVFIRNQVGAPLLSFDSQSPLGLVYNNFKISGTPETPFEAPLFFSLIDSRNIVVLDSVFLFIHEPFDINFNLYSLDLLEEYPIDGTHPYNWVDTYTGVTRDLYYKGERIARANPDGSKSCYCCGLTFEDFFRGIQRLNKDLGRDEDINGMTAQDMKYFIHLWFVQSTWGDGPGIALERFGLGKKIENMDEIKKGDYVQIWRTTGSGHSVIFINWIMNTSGDRIGIRYWSTQGSTNGINYNNEYFSGHGGTVNLNYTYFSRVWSPEDFIPFTRTSLTNYFKIVNRTQPIVPKAFMRNE